jgi:hypothetical protein
MDRAWKVDTTVKVMELVPVPLGVVTLILPVTAPTGTVAVIWVAELITKLARTPPNRTAVAPVNAVPVILTAVPVRPLVGENEEIVGAGTVTVKFAALVAVPPGVVTLILPVVAPDGTFVSIRVPWAFTVNDAPTPLNRTVVAPPKPLPLTRTEVPTGPLFGENEEIVGAVAVVVTVKFVALVAVPPGVVTLIFPVVAPVGTFVSIRVPWVFTVNGTALTPLNRTAVAPANPLPLIRTEVPTGPLDGENEEIVGAAAVVVTVKFVALVAVTPGVVVTAIFPVVAPLGTVVMILVPDPFTENELAATPPNITAVAPVRPVPLIVTEVPTGPLDGENEEIVGSPFARAEGTAKRPMRNARARQAEARRGSRPAIIRCPPYSGGHQTDRCIRTLHPCDPAPQAPFAVGEPDAALPSLWRRWPGARQAGTGCQVGARSGDGSLVSRSCPVPSAFITYTSMLPPPAGSPA